MTYAPVKAQKQLVFGEQHLWLVGTVAWTAEHELLGRSRRHECQDLRVVKGVLELLGLVEHENRDTVWLVKFFLTFLIGCHVYSVQSELCTFFLVQNLLTRV